MIKESNTIRVDKHAVAIEYNNEIEFCSFFSKVLKKQSRILEKVNARCHKPHKYKFGVQESIDVAVSKKLDNNTSNTLWKDEIWKEMEKF